MPLSREQEKHFLSESKRFMNLFRQANSAMSSRKRKRAEQLFSESLKIARKIKELQLELDPQGVELAESADGFLIAALKSLGVSYFADDDDNAEERSLPFLLEARALLEGAAEPDYNELYDIYEALCEVYISLKDSVKYEEISRLALATKEKEVGQWHPEIVGFLMDLAWALEEQKKYDESLTLKKDAFSIALNEKGPDNVEVIALKHAVACSNFLIEGCTSVEAIQKALATLTPEERKAFTGGVAAELESMRR